MLCRGRRRLPRVSIVLEEAFKWSSLHLWGRDGAVVSTCMLEEAVQRERPLPSRRGNTRCGRCTAVAGAALARPSTADSICLAGTRPMSPSPRGLHWPRPRRLARGSRRRCEYTCHQGDSEALRGTQVPSEALRCHQRHSGAIRGIRCHQRHSGVLSRGTRTPSSTLRCHPRHSGASAYASRTKRRQPLETALVWSASHVNGRRTSRRVTPEHSPPELGLPNLASELALPILASGG